MPSSTPLGSILKGHEALCAGSDDEINLVLASGWGTELLEEDPKPPVAFFRTGILGLCSLELEQRFWNALDAGATVWITSSRKKNLHIPTEQIHYRQWSIQELPPLEKEWGVPSPPCSGPSIHIDKSQQLSSVSYTAQQQDETSAIVQIAYCGICGGDITPWYIQRKAPTVLGHEPCGIIVAASSLRPVLKPGSRVFIHHHAPCQNCDHCLDGHPTMCSTWKDSRLYPGGASQYVEVRPPNITIDTLELPTHLSLREGATIEPTACVVRGVNKLKLESHDRVLVVGLGFIGLIAVQLAQLSGCQVTACDPLAPRRTQALASGAFLALTPSELETTSLEFDKIFVCPSSQDVVHTVTRKVAKGGKLLFFMAPPPQTSWEIPASELFFKEADLLWSYSCGPQETREALQLLAERKIDARELIRFDFPLSRAQEAYDLAKAPKDNIKTLLSFVPGSVDK